MGSNDFYILEGVDLNAQHAIFDLLPTNLKTSTELPVKQWNSMNSWTEKIDSFFC